MKRIMTYREAINEALKEEMRNNKNVSIFGIDVADHKRIFGTTADLVEEFGEERCFSTPLSEDAMTGFALGMAINGLRPIHVHMRVDFIMLAMNQLVNMVSSYYYGSGGKAKVPLVIRAVIGRGWGQAYQHSKTLQSYFAHIPGLKVLMPTTVNDMYKFLKLAIRDDNPVIIIEHRWLYDMKEEIDVTSHDNISELDKHTVLRAGKDITVVANSWMNIEALQAAEILKKNDVSVEIIDARVISHFDETTIVDSVKKTGHCIIADNDWVYCGFSAEIAAMVAEKCFDYLKSPVQRIGFSFTPCPCTRVLENEFYQGVEGIVRMVEQKLELPTIDLSNENFYSYENKLKGLLKDGSFV